MKLILDALTPGILALLGVFLSYLAVILRKHLSLRQIQIASDLAEKAVTAAEQIAGIDTMSNDAKYRWAADALSSLAAKAGLTLTTDQIKPLIENAVYNIGAWDRQLVTPPDPAPVPAAGSLAATAADPYGGPTAPYLFTTTGKTISGIFRSYFATHGDLMQQGMAVTDVLKESDRDVQYFERAVFEHHTENAGTIYEVLLRRLGSDSAAQAGLSGVGIPQVPDA